MFVIQAAQPTALNDKTPDRFGSGVRLRAAATYSPTWLGSTIGTNAFNFSVRNGKRWVHVVIATMILLQYRHSFCVSPLSPNGHIPLYAHILRLFCVFYVKREIMSVLSSVEKVSGY